MDHRKFAMVILAFMFLALSVQADAALWEGSNSKLVENLTKSPEKKVSDQSTSNLNEPNQSQIVESSQKKLSNLNVEVTSDVYSDKDRQVLYCPEGNFMVVRNRIYLEGSDLDKVEKVRYFLHETFHQPEGAIGDSANDFEIWIWTWGSFPIKAIITTKNGQEFERDYSFSFKSKFEEAQTKGIPQEMRCEE